MNTETMIKALRILAQDIQSDDGVANACIADAADMIEALRAENEALKTQVELLRNAAIQALHADDIEDEEDRASVFDKLNDAVLATPAQCLAETKAQTVEDAGKYLLNLVIVPPSLYFASGDALYKHAKQLRQAAKGE